MARPGPPLRYLYRSCWGGVCARTGRLDHSPDPRWAGADALAEPDEHGRRGWGARSLAGLARRSVPQPESGGPTPVEVPTLSLNGPSHWGPSRSPARGTASAAVGKRLRRPALVAEYVPAA